MFPTRDRLPARPWLGRAWLCCWLVVASACADGSGGGVDAAPGSDGGPCTPGCTGDAVRTCVPVEISTPCPLGCDLGAPACRELVPSNGAVRAQLEGVTADLSIPADPTLVLDTDEGAIFEFGNPEAELRPAGEGVQAGIGFYVINDDVSVLAVKSFTIEPDAALIVSGFNAIIILSEGEVNIQGQLDASAENFFNRDGNQSTLFGGPGGGDGARAGAEPAGGCAPGTNGGGVDGVNDKTGGGGGGLGSDGAPGGVGGDGTEPGAGGDAQSGECPGSDLVPLRGGSGGGAGGTGATAGDGGGGGGAIQITSFERIQIIGTPGQFVDGILANGGGGGAGDLSTGGGGGGSGGGILLEAPEIAVKGVILAANGGGGGGSDPASAATVGDDGLFDSRQADGGEGARPGGRGAAAFSGSTIGTPGADGTGGGGGGVGIIRFNVPEQFLEVEAATISPAFERGDPEAR